MAFPEAQAVRAALAAEGLAASDVERRDRRWLARLADGRMAWFAADAAGAALLADERRILRLIEARCAFRAPRVQMEHADGWDVRAPVPGVVDPTGLYHRQLADAALARRLGRQIGAALAEQHGKIAAADLPGLSHVVSWPMADDWLWARLPRAGVDAALLARIERALPAYRAAPVGERVLVHADLGLHNIALDPASDDLAGVFDYAGSALADRHEDFRYLIYDAPSETMLEGALEVYEPALGVSLDRERIRLCNAACAIGFLANRVDHAPRGVWAGRTLAQDVAWTDLALTRAGF